MKYLTYLLLQYFSINLVLGQLSEGVNLYNANVFGISKQHKNVFASVSVKINSNNRNTPATTLKTSKNFTDPNNGWTLWIQEELGVQDENWPIVEANESPSIVSEIATTIATPTRVLYPQENVTMPDSSESSVMPITSEQLLLGTNQVTTGDTECQASITEFSCQRLCRGDLIFEDNFDTMNWTKWHHEIRIPMDLDDGEFVSYQNRPENCYVNDGELHIAPSLLSDVPGFDESSIRTGTLDLTSICTGFQPRECYRRALYYNILPPIVSARIRTKRSFEFRFGRVEVRARLPRGDWMFPLILLEPSENIYGSGNYASGQMRVAFARGNEDLLDRQGNEIRGSHVLGGAVLSLGQAFRETWLPRRMNLNHLADEFHIYTLIWTDQYIALEIDGGEYARVRGGFVLLHRTHNMVHARLWQQGESMAPFDRKFFITLGLAAGGHSDFPDGSINPNSGHIKPWNNTDPKAALHFWNARDEWYSTWNGTDAGLHVDYVRVYAL